MTDDISILEAHLQKEKDEVQRLLQQVKYYRAAVKDLADAARLDLENDHNDEVGCFCDSGDPSVGIPETTCTQHLAIYYYNEIKFGL